MIITSGASDCGGQGKIPCGPLPKAGEIFVTMILLFRNPAFTS